MERNILKNTLSSKEIIKKLVSSGSLDAEEVLNEIMEEEYLSDNDADKIIAKLDRWYDIDALLDELDEEEMDENYKKKNKNGITLKERFVNVDEIHVPEWLWVAYETGDTSNLDDEEIVILRNFEKKHKNHILEANAEPSFLPTNDVTDEGDMCYTVQVFEDRPV